MKFYMKNNTEVESSDLCLHGKPSFEIKDLTPFLTLFVMVIVGIMCFHCAQFMGNIGGSLVSLIDAEWGSRVFCFGFLGGYWFIQKARQSPRQALFFLAVGVGMYFFISDLNLVSEFRSFVGIPPTCNDLF